MGREREVEIKVSARRPGINVKGTQGRRRRKSNFEFKERSESRDVLEGMRNRR